MDCYGSWDRSQLYPGYAGTISWLLENNFLLWNTPGSDDAVAVALG